MISWIMKLISGWLPIGVNSDGQKKSFGEWSGKIIWVVGIVIACMLFMQMWEHFFPTKPNVTTVNGNQIIQQGDQRDMMGFGCNIMRGYGRVGIKTK